MHVTYRYKYCDAHFFIITTQCLCCTLRVQACLLYCLSFTWMAPFCYGLYCGIRHFDFIRTLRVQCTLRVHDCSLLYCLSLTLWGPPFWFYSHPWGAVHPQGAGLLFTVLFYRSHGWRHFVMVCIVGAAILIYSTLGEQCILRVYPIIHWNIRAPECTQNILQCLFLIGYK